MATELKKLKLLSEQETNFWLDCIRANRGSWIPRMKSAQSNEPLFYTIGRAVYLDISQSENPINDYYELSKISNLLIVNVFGELIEKIRFALQTYLQEEVTLTDKLALPGFHIFFTAGIKAASNAEPHFDMQHMRVNWDNKWDSDKTISFTLPLQLPISGSGLEIWKEISFSDLSNNAAAKNCDVIREKYEIGTLYLQQGMIRHRIAETIVATDQDVRITLQGHGLRFNGVWILYW